jgi:hypothetical protein
MPQIGDSRRIKPTREQQRLANHLKNERRKRSRKANGSNRDIAHAKELRHAFGGAFGRAPASVHNACVPGTTAIRKDPGGDSPRQRKEEGFKTLINGEVKE